MPRRRTKHWQVPEFGQLISITYAPGERVQQPHRRPSRRRRHRRPVTKRFPLTNKHFIRQRNCWARVEETKKAAVKTIDYLKTVSAAQL